MLQQLVNGLMVGSSYALVATGYTLVFGVLRLLNLAHPEIFMFSSFVALFLMSLGMGLLASSAVAVLVCGVIGVLLYYAAFKPLGRDDFLAGFITSLAFGLILRTVITEEFGSVTQVFPSFGFLGSFRVGGALLSWADVLALFLAIGLMVGLHGVVHFTRLGRQLRAAASNRDAAVLLGVPVRRVIVYAFIVSSVLAGVAGILASIRYEGASPFVGIELGLKALAVMVIGGLGDIRGAFVAGLFLGLVETFVQVYAGPGWSSGLIWVVLIVVLVARPTGLFGTVTLAREV